MLRGILHSWLLISAFVAFGLAAAWVFASSPCQGGWCPSYKCFGPCGGSCRCVSNTPGGGVCVDIQRADDLLQEGWQELR